LGIRPRIQTPLARVTLSTLPSAVLACGAFENHTQAMGLRSTCPSRKGASWTCARSCWAISKELFISRWCQSNQVARPAGAPNGQSGSLTPGIRGCSALFFGRLRHNTDGAGASDNKASTWDNAEAVPAMRYAPSSTKALTPDLRRALGGGPAVYAGSRPRDAAMGTRSSIARAWFAPGPGRSSTRMREWSRRGAYIFQSELAAADAPGAVTHGGYSMWRTGPESGHAMPSEQAF